MTELDVLTLNAWFGYDGKGVVRMGSLDSPEERQMRGEGLLQLIARERPALMALQELCPVRVLARRIRGLGRWEVRHQVVNAGVKLLGRGIPWGFSEGLVLLVAPPYRVVWSGWRRLSGPPGTLLTDAACFQLRECRAALGARIEGPRGERFHFYTTHLHYSAGVERESDLEGWKAALEELGASPAEISATQHELRAGAKRRRDELEALLSWVADTAGDGPAIVAGDLNLRPEDPLLVEVLARHGFEDALQGTTEPSWDPENNPFAARSASPPGSGASWTERLQARYDSEPRRIDHILTRGLAHTDEAWVRPALDDQRRLVSDHSLLGVHLSLAH